MFNLFNLLNKNKIWDFAGGIHPPEMKLQSSQSPLRITPLPEELIIPLQQHLGTEGELLVKVGDEVLKGQPLTFGTGRTVPVHASTSGTIIAIEPCITAHPSGLKELCVRLRPDGKDQWGERIQTPDYQSLDADTILNQIHQAGIAGLGGAGFPTAAKLQSGRHGLKTLIINAAECEPYITADDRLMQEHANELIEGIRILEHLLKPEQILIGIEDNKPAAIKKLKTVLKGDKSIIVRVIPTKYPSGGAKQLTKILTGKEVPSGGRSSTIGVLMQNVGTVVAIKRAIIDGEPLIERVVTITGEAVTSPGNFWARLGTPVQFLLQLAGFAPQSEQMVIMGGPLMGFTLPDLNVPIVKISNCILAPSHQEMDSNTTEEACIRCGLCVEACPARLLPQQLYWFSRGQEHEKARDHNLFDCIECGACAYVCPSNIPLVQYYRQEKAEIRALDQENRRSTEAKIRFEAKQARMEREKLARDERHKKSAVQVDNKDKSAVQDALSRVKEKQANAGKVVAIEPGQLPDNAAVIAARQARKEQLRARQAEKQAVENMSITPSEPTSAEDPRKAALAAAIARAKAKKAAQNQSETPSPEAREPETTTSEKQDLHKDAVAAAIARVKAKKAQTQPLTETQAETPPAEETDPRKAAVAAAIARVKAKKAQTQPLTETQAETPPAEETDPRKAAVAAAIARVKAKKAQTQPLTETQAETPPAEETDPRKAAVAAAIARVKAKKAQTQPLTETQAETPPAEETDPRKAAVAAAIARVKAKKAQTQQLTETQAETPPAEETDPRKAAVAAAIARVKAKKAQTEQLAETQVETPPAEETDPRKAAVAAAIARVKAKKDAQEQQKISIE
ncbi:electron transport complex subunit RsxC [Photorhabdus laumondii subsp. laumondii]|uniref:Ion-translocating oxidoreductase complex subunit C n=2 Tax=Photorhabdus TaxID=29487 RepID=A0A6L9JG64_PHOLM|nr:electron transport complex subunit RsxC [Photorhabdus laumondii]NDK93570.1 electron transport complex subunit RsxC [Photorhabdus laumondii subsp. laumondii]NDL20114.1 electron transport complex subunit RsxC [Photorhabdus laumondii subsp. laumondii]NDL28888.1 electron transport complex subunit RsxC [Photorhabdus laumondii subsp. laumondii]NDL33702.1 electron transport complex subunit RsxC [Photorhabdus laumondii subsp. laumondii]NDL37939.1 electron transport complex subunit RsxC [Photorhabdu